MDLVVRGRLSVQRVNPLAWKAVELLAQEGGWSLELLGGKKTKKNSVQTAKAESKKRRRVEDSDSSEEPEKPKKSSKRARKCT
jgi:hypothetical protein